VRQLCAAQDQCDATDASVIHAYSPKQIPGALSLAASSLATGGRIGYDCAHQSIAYAEETSSRTGGRRRNSLGNAQAEGL
jgi:hypothetical protein